MAPSNTSFAAATEIASFPYDFTQTDINDGGTNFTVYYKFTAPTGAKVIAAWGFSGNIGSGYRPTLRPYLGPAGSPTQVLGIGSQNKPIQFPVDEGEEYFLEFTKNLDDAGPNELRVRVEVAPNSAVQEGDIAVNDDNSGFPTVILSPTVDFLVRRFYKGTASSDDGNILYPAQQIMLVESSDDTYRLYNYNFEQIAQFNAIGDGSLRVSPNNESNKWYIGSTGAGGPSATKARYATVVNGVLGTVVNLSTVSSGMTCLAANLDDTILYHAGLGSSVNTPVKRWDIVNGVALSDLAAGVANYQNEDIMVLSDGTILVSYYKSSEPRDFFVRQYDPDGTLLNTYNFGSDITGIVPKICRALDDPDTFWAWTQSDSSGENIDTFSNVRISDGTVLSSVNHVTYTVGVYDGEETATPSGRLGNSTSCTFFIMPSTGIPSLFQVVPNKRTDHNGVNDVAIPTPTFRTGQIP